VSRCIRSSLDIAIRTFPTNALHPRTLAIHDFRRIQEGLVQQDLDAVCAGVKQSAHGPAFQQARNAAGNIGIVAADFVGHQKSRRRGALRSGGQTVIRLEKNGASVRRMRAYDDRLEFFKFLVRNGLFLDFQHGGKSFSQRVALVDGRAAITPRESDTDSSLLRFPGDRFTSILRSGVACSSNAFSCEKGANPRPPPPAHSNCLRFRGLEGNPEAETHGVRS